MLESDDPAVRAFVARYLTGGQFTAARIDATTDTLEFPGQGWSLRYTR